MDEARPSFPRKGGSPTQTGKWHVAERKQGRAAGELVVDDRCGGLGGLDAVEASAGGERRALGYFGEVLVEEHPGDEFLA